MKRREFLKTMAAGVAVAALPSQALGQSTVPVRPASPNDDATAYLQWHIDHRKPIPAGVYTATETLMVRPGGAIIMERSRLMSTADVTIQFEPGFAPNLSKVRECWFEKVVFS